ncbi:motility associated factor glycosyltransferase family protein [bacterium]|nr:motility associated factor glycosyltransferase family protein [bacterium]
MQPFWEANRQRATARFPWLAAPLAVPPSLIHRLEPTPAGLPALVVVEEGRETAYTSRRDPRRAAARFAAEHPLQGSGMAVLFGFALGYAAEALLRSAEGQAALLTVEPDVELLRAALSARDLGPLLSHPRFFLCTPDSLDAAMRVVAPLAGETAPLWLAHGPSLRRFPRQAEAVRARVDLLLARHHLEVHHLRRYGRIIQENVLRNAPAYLSAGRPANLAGAWRARPAVVIAAGPSVHKNLSQLAKYADRALILCVDTSLRLCLARDLVPDAVVAVDPTPENFRHFEAVLDDPRLAEIPLVFDAEVSARVVEAWPGPRWALPLDKSETLRMLAEARGEREAGTKGASVAHSAFGLARQLGASPIMFVGLDLAYASDGATHAAGTALARHVDLSQCLWVPGVHEARVPTPALDHYRRLLEEEIAENGGALSRLH